MSDLQIRIPLDPQSAIESWCLGSLQKPLIRLQRKVVPEHSVVKNKTLFFDELNILQSIVCLTTYPADPAK